MTVGCERPIYIKDRDPYDLKVFDRILADSAGDLIKLSSENVTSPAALVDFY